MSSAFLGFGFFTRPPSCLLGKEDSFFFSLADRPHYRLPGYVSKRSLSVQVPTKRSGPLSVRQIARTAPFVRAATPAVASPPCAPAFSPPFPPTLFTPRSPCFFNRALSPCFFRLSLCRSYRRFVSPRRPTCPHPAACRLRPTLRIVVSPVRAPSVCLVALSPLCPDVYTPNGFVFRTITPCDPFRPRAGFHVKQTRTPRCFYVFNRVTSKFSPTPFARMPISPLGFERLPRANFSARAPVSLLNK